MNIQAQLNQLLTLGAAAYRTSDLYKEQQLNKQISGSQNIQQKEYEGLKDKLDDIKANPEGFSTDTALYRESATNAYNAAKAKYELKPNEKNAKEYNDALQNYQSDAIIDAYTNTSSAANKKAESNATSSLLLDIANRRNLTAAQEERLQILRKRNGGSYNG